MTERLQEFISRRSRLNGSRSRALTFLTTILFVLLTLTIIAWPALAGFRLGNFTGLSTETSLELQWYTLTETDLSRWDIYCKDEAQDFTEYHPIGTHPALGENGEGALYTFPVPELTPGSSYCFRLIEVNGEGVQGQSFDRCGWGINVTPTPTTIPPEPAGVVGSTPVGSLTQPISGEGAAPLQDVPTSSPTPTEVNVEPTSVATPTAVQIGESPLEGGGGRADTGSSAGSENQASGAVAMAADPTLAPTATPTEDPGYIVVTATPSSEAADVAKLPPTFTPLPTATAEPAALLSGFSEWSAEDLMLASLCFVFFGAGGLGILGITSLSLYLRSRSEAGRRE